MAKKKEPLKDSSLARMAASGVGGAIPGLVTQNPKLAAILGLAGGASTGAADLLLGAPQSDESLGKTVGREALGGALFGGGGVAALLANTAVSDAKAPRLSVVPKAGAVSTPASKNLLKLALASGGKSTLLKLLGIPAAAGAGVGALIGGGTGALQHYLRKAEAKEKGYAT